MAEVWQPQSPPHSPQTRGPYCEHRPIAASHATPATNASPDSGGVASRQRAGVGPGARSSAEVRAPSAPKPPYDRNVSVKGDQHLVAPTERHEP
jgi:hypothetical protein